MNQTDSHLHNIQRFVGGTASFNFLDVSHKAKIVAITEISPTIFSIDLDDISAAGEQIFYGERLMLSSQNCGVTSNPLELVFDHVFRPAFGFGPIFSLRLPT